MSVKKLVGAAVLSVLLVVSARADDSSPDCDKCHDHPTLSRYPGSILVGYDQVAFDEQAYPVSAATKNGDGENVAPKTIPVAGKRSRLFYFAQEDRSGFEVFQNYAQALDKAGFTTIWSCSGEDACGPNFSSFAVEKMHLDLSNTIDARQGFADATQIRYLVATLARPQGDVMVAVMAADLEFHAPKRPGVYVVITEAKEMDVDMVTVDANALNKRILDTGKAVVYGIHFDLGNAVIKPESKPQLDEIASLLKQHADIRLAITDHTDSRGTADDNQKLSQQRGDAIVATLVNDYGIKPYRLSAQGLGASLPIASNDTPEGRAKNQRVELVRLSIGIAP